MRMCPFCHGEILEEAKVCKHCNATVVKRCTACSEEILAAARRCRYCGQDQGAPGAAPQVANDRPCGERREIVMTLLLILVTCGFYGLFVLYKIGEELNEHQGQNRINAGMDLVLTFVTCGLWGIYLMYKYPQALDEIVQEEGSPKPDLVLPCLLLTFFGAHIVAVLILQNELNKHWQKHLGPAA